MENKKSDIKATKSIFKYLTIIIFSLIIIILIYFVSNNKINQQKQKEIIEFDRIHAPIINKKLYTNLEFGFSLNLPEKIEIKSCKKDSDGFYNLTFFQDKLTLSPSIIFVGEKSNTFYITTDFFYVLTDIKKIKDKNNFSSIKYSNCQKENTNLTSIKRLKNRPSFLTFYVGNTKNDNELEKFIQSIFGPSCKIENKIISSKENVYIVSILGDGKDLGNTSCGSFANKIIIEINPLKGKTVIFDLGQEVQIGNPIDDSNIVEEIINSFKFD